MRLIDADRLLKPSFTDMFDKPVKMDMFSRYAIESQPTVEAIPIEWIKNVWLEKPENQGPIEFFPPATFELIMNWLIEDWEKENETN